MFFQDRRHRVRAGPGWGCLLCSGRRPGASSGEGRRKRELSLAVLKRGDHFGEIALLLDAPRSSAVRAADDLVLPRLDRKEFLNVLANRPDLRVALERCQKEFAIRDFLKRFTALGAVPAPSVTGLSLRRAAR